MPLPNLEKIIPIFDVIVPSSGAIIKCRPFLVKEEKLLLIALEGDEKNMQEAMTQIIAACVISPLKVETLANFDVEYIFLQLRAKSVNEFVELAYRCHNEVILSAEEIEKRRTSARFRKQLEALPEGEQVLGTCDNIVKIRLDLRTVNVQTNPEHTKTIMLTDTVGMTMKYPNVAVSQMLSKTKQNENQETSITDVIKTIAMCVESVFDEQSVYSNFQTKEMVDWIEKLTQPQFVKIQEFFETMPKLAHDVDFLCSKCGYQQILHLEGLTSFFG